jgi:adenine-specific DNA-methyltransferase
MSKKTKMPEKMDLRSMDVGADNRAKLKQLFPTVFAETRNEKGKLVESIDFEKLKAELGTFSDLFEARRERYGMDWPGKKDCMKLIQQPSIATLKPCREESVDFDTTENLFIEGDNLEVLKLLQKSYYGKIKMIYIDPPYNTGNEFIYPDDYAESLETYLAYAGLADDEGKKFSTNTPNEGRFHTKWLNMMYPRLYLARNLLQEDGVFFISIDDNEVTNLRKICDEVFGEENFIAELIWEKTRKNDSRFFSVGHEYILAYVKNEALLRENDIYWREDKPGAREIFTEYERLRKQYGDDFDLIQKQLKDFYEKLPRDNPARKHARYNRVDARGVWRDDNMSWPGGGGPTYDVVHPKTGKPCKVPPGGWRFSTPEKMQEMIEAGVVAFREDHSEPPIRKTYLVRRVGNNQSGEENVGKQVMGTYFYRSALQATRTLIELFEGKLFDNPKDHEIVKRLVSYTTFPNDVILDFFSGSCTTAHAVLDLNKEDGSKRKFIMVQLPEPCEEKSEAYKAGYNTIADIGKERIRRVINKIEEEQAAKAEEAKGKLPGMAEELLELDLGFKVLKLDKSNFKVWDGSKPNASEAELEKQLELHIDHIDPKVSQEDILFELLLKAGFMPTEKVEKQGMAGKNVFSVADGALLICLENEITRELIDAVAEAEPMQFICLDRGFQGNDQLKANAVQTFAARSQGRDKAEQIIFRTV